MTLMRAEMQAAGIATNTFAGRLLLARGALVAVGGAIATAMSALNPILLIITAVSLAFSLFDGALSKNSKQSAELSGSLDKLDANALHLTKTIDTINQKPFLERMSPESLKVKATALGEVSTAISSTISDLLKADKAASGWDKFVDGIKTLWGGDMLSKTSKSLATGITSGLANIAGSPEAKALNKDLSNILKIDTETATFQQVQDSIKKIGRESPKDLKLVEEGFKRISLASQVSAAKGTELVDAFKKLADLKQTIGSEFLPKDDLTKFGQELALTSQKLAIALDDPQQKLNAIIQLSANAVSIPGATFEQVSALNEAASLAKNIQVIEAKQLENKQQLIDKQEELSKLVGKERAASIAAGKQTQLSGLNQEGVRQVNKLKADLKELKTSGDINIKVKTELTSKLEGYAKEIETATLGTYKAGADIVAKQISAEFIKAGKVVSDAYVSIIGETEATIKIKADSERALVNAQLQQIMSQRDLTIATRELSLQLQKKSLEDYLQNNREGRDGTQRKLANVESQLEAVDAAKTGDFSKLKLSTNTKDLKNLNVEADNFTQNMRASAAAANNLQAQLKAITIGEKDAVLRASFAEPKKKLEAEERSVALTKQGLDIQGKLVTQGNIAFLSAKQTLEVTQLDLQQRIAILANDVEIARQKQIIKDPGASKKIKDAAIDRKAKLEAEGETLKTQQQQQKTNLANSQIQEKLGATAFNAEEARKREAENAELVLAKKSEELKIQESLFGMYSSIGLLSETQKINQKFLLEQKSAELDYEQKIAKLKSSAGQQMGQLESREEAIWTQIGAGTGNQAALIAELDKIAEAKALITARTNEEAASAAKVRDNTLSIANAIKTAGLEQERYNQLLENSSALAESLGNVFGDVGTKLGSLADSLTKIAISTEQGSKALEKIGKDAESAWNAGDIDKAIELESEYEKQKKKNNKTELDGNIKAVSGTKALFKEKTFAYKALDKIEKAMHLYKMAVFLKETAMDIWATGVSVANSTTRTGASIVEAGVDGVKAVVKAMSNLPTPFNFIAGAATAAVVAGLLSSIGGKGPNVSGGGFTANSEQIQETQGTGQTWDASGKKVSDIGGILGDDEAKANSIVNSLEILQNNSFKSLDYDNRLLRSFQGVADAIGKATGTIITSGLRTVSDKIALMLGTSKEGGFGSSIPLVGKLFSSIFGGGSSETQSLQSQRLELSGTFASVADNINSGLRQITDVLVRWEVDGGLFGSDDAGSYIKPILGTVPEDVKATFTEVFSSLKSGYEAIADLAGADNPVNFVAEKLKTVNLVDSQGNPLKFDYTGLKGDEIKSELEAYFSKINNIALKSLFPEFMEFETAGEDYGTTVIRIIQNTKQLQLALTSIGSASAFAMQGLQGYRLGDKLVEVFGGLENFIDQSKYFANNFLTEAERLVPVQKAVTEEMARLGYANVDTREEFKLLVQSFDLTNPAVYETYQALMSVQEGFIAVTEAAVKEAEERKSLEQKLFELTATREQLRERELEGLFAGNRALQRQIWLVEEQSEALKTSATSFRDFSKQVQDFRNSLLLGAGSTLTPGQKYAEAKSQFDTIYAQALAGDKVAMSKVTNSAQTFLDASKTYLASSTAYTNDFNTVLTKLDNASISAEASASVAELQLTALGVQTTLLTSINANIATIAGVPQAAGGGRVKGLTLVGELGPELVDFTNPGQVYTAEQTAGMFAPKAGVSNNMNQVVQELRQVRQEIAQLRKDQQQQTGDLIVSNYDANNRAAEAITTEVANTATQKEWQQRNKVAVV
jgi:hypothetical protein